MEQTIKYTCVSCSSESDVLIKSHNDEDTYIECECGERCAPSNSKEIQGNINKGFIATAQVKERIVFYGEADSSEKALKDFISSGEFKEHCEAIDANVDDEIEVSIFKAIYNGSSEWDDDIHDPEWEFVIGEKVDTKQISAVL